MNMLSTLTVDSFLGKIDKHSLSEETLMELLIGGISNTEKICGDNDNPKSVSEWKGLKLNYDNDIITINWCDIGLKGSIDLQWLPFALEDFDVSTNEIQGTVDLTCLPDGLEYLVLCQNRFEGTIDLTRLPSGLIELYLDENLFSGWTDFTQLPQSLKYLNVTYTGIEGEIAAFDGFFLADILKVKDMRR